MCSAGVAFVGVSMGEYEGFEQLHNISPCTPYIVQQKPTPQQFPIMKAPMLLL